MAAPPVPESNAGYIVDIKNQKENFTKLHRACWLGNESDVRNCLKSIPVNSKDDENRSPLHLAAAKGNIAVIEMLLEKDPDVNDQDINGKTPLIKAIEGYHEKTVHSLIEADADVNLKDRGGNTAIHIALNTGQYDVAQYLLQYTTEVNTANKNGITALHILAETKRVKLAKKFIHHGASVESKDKKLRTPLMLACKKGYFPMISLLLKNRADVTAEDAKGWTASDYASIVGNTLVINILEQYARSGISTFNDDKESKNSTTTDESEETEDIKRKRKRKHKTPTERTVPILLETDEVLFQREKAKKRHHHKKGEKYQSEIGIHKSTSKLHEQKIEDEGKTEDQPLPVPDIVAAMQLSANQLGDIQSWLNRQQDIAQKKREQCEQLKVHVKRLLAEKEQLIATKENLKKNITKLKESFENVASKTEAEVLRNELIALREGLDDLQTEHNRIQKEKEELEQKLDEQQRIKKKSGGALADKAELIKNENQAVQDKLADIENHIRPIIEDLSKKCKMANELVNHLKILLRGTYKLLEEKHGQINKVMDELIVQENLINDTKESYQQIKEETMQVKKNIEEVGTKMTLVKKYLIKVQKQMEKQSLMKKLVSAGVMNEQGEGIKTDAIQTGESEKPMKKVGPSKQKGESEESKKNNKLKSIRIKDKDSKEVDELEVEPEIKELAAQKMDPTGLMFANVDAPTVCKTSTQAVRYSWIDEKDEDTLEDLNIYRKHYPSDKASAPHPYSNDAGVSGTEIGFTTQYELPASLHAKLACVIAKYSYCDENDEKNDINS
ncbi:POTE ankyrin domain family member B2-like [Centruroides sculpturatus]|uniref:POTE ankyrin domain family member B2-like n=1 Tax=Centruroides sculpturatus TaxID=218467 RepID=UPI000C6E204D|nr:POTE ankyrin domain family member B2-like [Centruroides sculpturatus]